MLEIKLCAHVCCEVFIGELGYLTTDKLGSEEQGSALSKKNQSEYIAYWREKKERKKKTEDENKTSSFD